MNTGLQDAYNLAWKLALVVGGRAPTRAARFLRGRAHPDRAAAARHHRPRVPAGRLRQLARRPAAHAGARPDRRVRDGPSSGSAVRVSHRLPDRHPLPREPAVAIDGGLPAGAPRAGDRFPWLQLQLAGNGPVEDLFRKFDDMRFHLLVVGQPVPAAAIAENLLQVHGVPDDPANDAELARAQIPTTSFYLLRPDGHIGLAGTKLGVRRGRTLSFRAAEFDVIPGTSRMRT